MTTEKAYLFLAAFPALLLVIGLFFELLLVGVFVTLIVVGFAAFGKNPKNCIPILVGVVPASFVKIRDASTTVVVIAGLFGTTLAERLVVRRQPELENYYRQLAEELEDNSEISLVGMMCDSIELDREGESISLVLVRMV